LLNDDEISTVLKQLTHLQSRVKFGSDDQVVSVAVIAGYAAQVELLAKNINEGSHQWPHLDIEVASIDRFQGNEKDVAIVSLVRGTNEWTLGHLDEKRMNVAFSRARDALIIVGSTKMVDKVGEGSKLAEVLDYIRKNRNDCTITSDRQRI
ncbi:AAA domain-containing protein, partial [Pseudomonas sp.]|uniref:AAA domain-containing protein n=1 Tax=Pseudomonas sp. TaxID=306 RepID=UPI00262449D6